MKQQVRGGMAGIAVAGLAMVLWGGCAPSPADDASSPRWP